MVEVMERWWSWFKWRLPVVNRKRFPVLGVQCFRRPIRAEHVLPIFVTLWQHHVTSSIAPDMITTVINMFWDICWKTDAIWHDWSFFFSCFCCCPQKLLCSLVVFKVDINTPSSPHLLTPVLLIPAKLVGYITCKWEGHHPAVITMDTWHRHIHIVHLGWSSLELHVCVIARLSEVGQQRRYLTHPEKISGEFKQPPPPHACTNIWC